MALVLYGSPNFQSTLNVPGGIDDSQTTGIILQSVSNLDTKGGIIGLDWASTINTSTYEIIEYTGISGNELTGVTRGKNGTTGKAHANGAVCAAIISTTHIERIADRLTSRDAILASDPNGNEILKTSYVTSAVNEITTTNAATNNPPTSSATGGDTNIDYKIATKGSGVLKVNATTVTNSAGAVTTTGIEDASVTARKVKALYDIKNNATGQNINSSTYVNVTNLTCSVTVEVASKIFVFASITNTNGGGYADKSRRLELYCLSNTTSLAGSEQMVDLAGNVVTTLIGVYEAAGAGTYTFIVRAKNGDGSNTTTITNKQMIAIVMAA